MVEADALEVEKASMAKRRVAHDRTPHRITDPNHVVCAATAGEGLTILPTYQDHRPAASYLVTCSGKTGAVKSPDTVRPSHIPDCSRLRFPETTG